MLSKTNINKFKQNGYIILKNYIKPSLINSLKDALFTMFSYNLKKSVRTNNLEDLIYRLEKEDHNKVYNVQKAISSSSEAITLIDSLKMGDLYSKFYNADKKKIHLTLFQTPVQFPNDDRFDFKWHQESGSYAGYSNILTCWFPILGPVNEIDGSMTLIPKSHKNGIRETFYVKKKSGLNDWTINLNPGEDRNAEIVKINPGDIVLFDSSVIHRSIANSGNRIRVTGIVRALDICSGNQILPLNKENSHYIEEKFTR